MPDTWTKSAPKITDSEALKKIRVAVAKGPIFLRHALYHGGGSPHWDIVTNQEAFHSHIDHAKPGDWLTVWSIAALIDAKAYLAEAHYEKLDFASQTVQDKLSVIREFLNVKRNEALFVVVPQKGQPEADLNDIDGWDGFVEMVKKFAGCTMNLYAFDAKILDDPQYMVADAKVPNSAGEVPMGGAY